MVICYGIINRGFNPVLLHTLAAHIKRKVPRHTSTKISSQTDDYLRRGSFIRLTKSLIFSNKRALSGEHKLFMRDSNETSNKRALSGEHKLFMRVSNEISSSVELLSEESPSEKDISEESPSEGSKLIPISCFSKLADMIGF